MIQNKKNPCVTTYTYTVYVDDTFYAQFYYVI